MDLSKLNEAQLKAVKDEGKYLLVIAGAGSGKTNMMTHKIAYTIEVRGVKPHRLLALTFTNKAATEMRTRVEKLCGDTKGMMIGTFHSVCIKLLKQSKDAVSALGYDMSGRGFTIADEEESEKILKECYKDLNIDTDIHSPKMVRALISGAKDRLEGYREYEKEYGDIDIVSRLYKAYQKKLLHNNLMDFDDIIFNTVKIMVQNPDVLAGFQTRFKHIFVDEYQDTNYAQDKLIQLIAGNENSLCVVGDDDQGIYSWRGAIVTNILEFDKKYEGAKVIKLEQNYRSSRNIIEAANCVIQNNKSRRDKKLWTEADKGEKVQLIVFGDDQDEVRHIVERIKLDVKYKKADYKDFCILYRISAISRKFEKEFIRNNMTYVVIGGFKFYERAEVKDILSYLKLINNKQDSLSFKRAIVSPKRGIGETTINKLSTLSDETGISMFNLLYTNYLNTNYFKSTEIQKLREFARLIEYFEQRYNEIGLPELVRDIIKKTGYEAKLLESKDKMAPDRLSNIWELVTATEEYENTMAEAIIEDNAVEGIQISILEGFLEYVSLMNEGRNEENDNKIKLMTIHASKGLEFNIVYVVGLEEVIFPSSMSIREGNLEEERRLMYVAMTRAKRRLHLTRAEERTIYAGTQYNPESRFIKEIDDCYLEKSYR